MALDLDGASLTYPELERRVARAAAGLRGLGVVPGDRLAMATSSGLGVAILLHAAPRVGAAFVPLDPDLPAPRRDRMLDLAGAVALDAVPDGDPEPTLGPGAAPPGDAEALVIFTSGTSGEPRPIALTHRNLAASAVGSAWALGVDPADRWLCVLPLFHVGGLSILVRSAIYGTTAVVRRFEVEAARDLLERGEVTLVSLVPTMLMRLREAGFTSAPALRGVLLGGGPIPAELLEWARDTCLPVVATYGMTETASQVATQTADDAVAGIPGARLVPGAAIEIAGDGEILVRGPMVAPGALAEDGRLHTGDRGRLDADGRLLVEGRLADTIISGGENVAPAAVEEALRSHPGVSDAAVVGRPDGEWGEAVTAFVVVDGPVDHEDLIAHCRELLARHELPKHIEVVSELPRNAAGKLVKRKLPD